MFAMALEGNSSEHDHFIVSFDLLEGLLQEQGGVLCVAGKVLFEGARDAGRSFEQAGAIRIVAGPADDRPQRRFDFRPVGPVIVVLGIRVSSQRFYKCVHRYLQSQCLVLLTHDMNRAGHVGVDAAKVFDRAGFGHLLPSGLPGNDHDVPIAARCCGRVIDEVVIHPFDRIAGVDPNLNRRKGEVADPDLHDFARDPDVSACDLQQEN
jgi:hypothetical protein